MLQSAVQHTVIIAGVLGVSFCYQFNNKLYIACLIDYNICIVKTAVPKIPMVRSSAVNAVRNLAIL